MQTNEDLINKARDLNIQLIGVFSKDNINTLPKNGSYIFNLQDNTDEYNNFLGGTHWTALYIENQKAFYMDSFGKPPPSDIQLFLKRFIPYRFNKKQIQNIRSGVCGYYCLYFLWFMTTHRKLPLNDRFSTFLSLWSNDVTKNQTLLEKYIKPL